MRMAIFLPCSLIEPPGIKRPAAGGTRAAPELENDSPPEMALLSAGTSTFFMGDSSSFPALACCSASAWQEVYNSQSSSYGEWNHNGGADVQPGRGRLARGAAPRVSWCLKRRWPLRR